MDYGAEDIKEKIGAIFGFQRMNLLFANRFKNIFSVDIILKVLFCVDMKAKMQLWILS